MAVRLGITRTSTVRRWVFRLLDGKAISLDRISDILWCCGGAELEFTVKKS
jgi:hypothetical protein